MVIVRRGSLCQYFCPAGIAGCCPAAPAVPGRWRARVAGEAECPQLFQIGADAVGQKSARGCNKISAAAANSAGCTSPYFSAGRCPNQTASCGYYQKRVPFLTRQRTDGHQSLPLLVGVQNKGASRMHPQDAIGRHLGCPNEEIRRSSGSFCRNSGLANSRSVLVKTAHLEISWVNRVIDCPQDCQRKAEIRHRFHAVAGLGTNGFSLRPAFWVLPVVLNPGGGREDQLTQNRPAACDHPLKVVLIKRNVPACRIICRP